MRWAAVLALVWAGSAAADGIEDQTMPILVTVRPAEGLISIPVREGPGEDFAVLDAMQSDGATLEMTAVSADERWARINIGGMPGWIPMDHLRMGPVARGFRCFGTEPFWGIRWVGSTVVWDLPVDPGLDYENPPLPDEVVHLAPPGFDGEREAVVVTHGATRTTVVAHRGICSDGMSDAIYGFTATVIEDSAGDLRILEGCCTLQP